MGPKSYWSRRINAKYTAITTFKVIQGHRILVPICDFLLANNTNSPSSLHRFQVMADYWSNFRQRHGSASLYGPAGSDLLRMSEQTLPLQKLEWLSHPDAKKRTIVCWFIRTKYHNMSDWQTDRRTNRLGLAITAVCIASNTDAL